MQTGGRSRMPRAMRPRLVSNGLGWVLEAGVLPGLWCQWSVGGCCHPALVASVSDPPSC